MFQCIHEDLVEIEKLATYNSNSVRLSNLELEQRVPERFEQYPRQSKKATRLFNKLAEWKR